MLGVGESELIVLIVGSSGTKTEQKQIIDPPE